MHTEALAPVWISTDRQIEALVSGYRSASIFSKLTGRYDIPDGAAFLKGVLMPWMRMPLVFVAQGALSIGDAGLSYQPRSYPVFGWSIRSPFKDLSFVLPRDDVISVEAADFKSPVMSVFDLPFTRIRTGQPGELGNLLFCVGGRVDLRRMRVRGLELREKLMAWANA